MPKLWDDTIETHRRAVRHAVVDTTATLVAEHGLRSVSMSEIAERTGIGRATLYKYFPDVEAILVVWHERQVADHLEHLSTLRDRGEDVIERIAAVLEAYALILHEHHGSELAALLHRGEHVAHAQQHLHGFVGDLLVQGVGAGEIRSDISSGELATYCLHALTAAGRLPSKAAVRRLASVTLDGLRRTHSSDPAEARPDPSRARQRGEQA